MNNNYMAKKSKSEFLDRFYFNTKSYIFNFIPLTFFLVFLFDNKYYKDFLLPEARKVILYLYAIFIVLSFFHYLFVSNKIKSTGWKLYDTVRKIIRSSHNGFSEPLSSEEKNTLLFTIIKVFFLPMYINFLCYNIKDFNTAFIGWRDIDFDISLKSYNNNFFNLFLACCYIIDVTIFLFAYLFESNRFKNKMKSVDQSALGWFVAIICYPPFNNVTSYYVSWNIAGSKFSNVAVETFVNTLLLFTWFVYTWASVGLGMKAANLTNRGIIGRGPYRYMRHPAYTFKNICWWLMTIPALTIKNIPNSLTLIGSMLFINYIYYLRALTEERHLESDPDYKRYQDCVPGRFIPSFKSKKFTQNL